MKFIYSANDKQKVASVIADNFGDDAEYLLSDAET
jgi:hypothetical protein